MLPFLKQNKEVSVAVPTEHIEREHDGEEKEYDLLESAAEDLISAMHSKSVKSVCEALRSAFDILDSEPHHEGPHLED